MSTREVRMWRRLLTWGIVLALLGGAAYAVESGVADCEHHGGHYDGATGCTTPSGVTIPHS